ncbi:hypothetical protein CANMA_001923 [Candida margitis]|uniref:uncharacterized protein n=1 Tax=Candida margitis TaxID=1775924 RepID=UPI0022264A68|nr:uncharacterized protein CANMA_001923 [Candida margitis]KAI5969033.1 hypothetical protein CANMA_001923 [Candida margitis]
MSQSFINALINNPVFIMAIVPILLAVGYYLRKSCCPLTKSAALQISSMAKGKNEKSATITSAQKMAERPFGHWEPDYDFKTPTPNEYKGWSLTDTKPIAYRAFRHKYTVNMGIRPMDWDNWIELDNNWLKYHNLKKERLAERGDKLYAIDPCAMDAAWEVLDELCRYLPARYPTMFEFDKDKRIMKILPTKEVFDFNEEGFNPILTCGLLIQDDIVIMVESKKDGSYSLQGGCACLPGFWKLTEKYKMTLDQLHTEAGVPKYKSHLATGMNKFFRRLTVDKPVFRNNYFLQLDGYLGWSKSLGDEDDDKWFGWKVATPATDISDIHFRSERQSLRRLPISGAVIFTVRSYFIPMTELCEEPYVPRRLLNGITSWTEDVGEYKGFHKFKDILLPYLEEKAKEQEEQGLDYSKEPQNFPYGA